MPAIKLGVDLAALRLPFPQALRAAAKLGANAVEIDARGEIAPHTLSRTAVRQLRKMLEDMNLRVCAVTFRTRRGYATEADLDARIAGTKAAMEMAYSLGTDVVVGHLGRVPAADSPSWTLLVEVLQDLGNYGLRVGATLAAETGSESGEDLARLLAVLPAGTLGIDFNPGKLLLGGFSPIDAVASVGRQILHVHVSDAVRGSVPGMGQSAPIGQGDADFPAILGALEEQRYRGYYTVERQGGHDSIREISDAVEYLRKL